MKLKRKQVLFLSQLVILVICIMTNSLVYATNDDTTMVSLASGAYGEPTEYIINMHIFVGYLLKIIFSVCSKINWITILYLFLYLFSIWEINCILIKEEEEKTVSFAKATVIDIVFTICISYFSFTVVAYFSVTAAMLRIIKLLDDKYSARYFIGPILLLVFGMMIRPEVATSLVIVCLPLAIRNGIKSVDKKVLLFILCVFGLMVSLQKSNSFIMNLNPVQQAFFEWGETRSSALDCAAVPYNENVFENAGISEAQYRAIYEAFYYSYDSVDLETMQTIIELNDFENKYNFDMIDFFESHFAYLNDLRLFDNMYKILFAVTFILFCLCGKKEQKPFLVFVWIATVGIEFLFFFLNRALYRVVMPNYVFSILIMLMCCNIDKYYITKMQMHNISFQKMLLVGTIGTIIVGINGRVNYYNQYHPWVFSDERKQVLDYMEENADKIFLAGNPSVFAVGVTESVWKPVGEEYGWNLIGNWETYSVPYFELMSRYGIADPYNVLYEAIDNDNVLILTSYGEDFVYSNSWILDLVYEVYGVKTEFQMVDFICHNYVGEEYSEEYITYKLVSTR